jgi:hypothetical protein
MCGGSARPTRLLIPINLLEARMLTVEAVTKQYGAFTAVDGTNVHQMTYGEIEGRRQVAEYFRFLQSRVPGFENAYIVDTAPQLGIRETRRFIGGHVLSGEDVLNCVDFDDTIGVNGWPLEMHVAGDVRWIWPDIPTARGFNQLPYRMIVPENVNNLLTAGRCASMTHEGHSAARVTGACFVIGQAAGTAADLALKTDVACRDIDVTDLQQRLRSLSTCMRQRFVRFTGSSWLDPPPRGFRVG